MKEASKQARALSFLFTIVEKIKSSSSFAFVACLFACLFVFSNARRVSSFSMLALNSGRAVVVAAAPARTTTATIQRRRRSSSIAVVVASAEPQDFNYASPKPYSSPQAGEDLTPYFGKVHAHDAKPANTIHAW